MECALWCFKVREGSGKLWLVAWSIQSLSNFAGLVLSGLLVGGCSGGQTGDGGTPAGGDPCAVVETKELEKEEARELGFEAESATAAVFGESDELEFEFLLQATPALWVEHGLEPPADRSTPARLRLRPTQSISMTRREPQDGIARCSDRFEVLLEVEFELPELGQSLDASGAIALETDWESSFVLLDVAGLGKCGLASSPEEDIVFSCSADLGERTALGSRRCLDAAEWREVPAEVGKTGRSTQALVEAASNAFPMRLSCGCHEHCSDSPPGDPAPESVTMHFSAVLPESYCSIREPYAQPSEEELIPALVRYALGDEPERYVSAFALLRDDGFDIDRVALRVDESGATTVSASIEWLINDINGAGYPWTCAGEVVSE